MDDHFGYAYASRMILDDKKEIRFMGKDTPEDETDSGWRFASGEEPSGYLENSENIQKCELNDILKRNPEIREYLNAPVGTYFIKDMDTNTFEKWNPEKKTESKPMEYSSIRRMVSNLGGYFSNGEFLTYEFAVKNKQLPLSESMKYKDFLKSGGDWLRSADPALFRDFLELARTGKTHNKALLTVFGQIRNHETKVIINDCFYAACIVELLPDNYLKSFLSGSDFKCGKYTASEICDHYHESQATAFILLWMLNEDPEFYREFSYIYSHRNVRK